MVMRVSCHTVAGGSGVGDTRVNLVYDSACKQTVVFVPTHFMGSESGSLVTLLRTCITVQPNMQGSLVVVHNCIVLMASGRSTHSLSNHGNTSPTVQEASSPACNLRDPSVCRYADHWHCADVCTEQAEIKRTQRRADQATDILFAADQIASTAPRAIATGIGALCFIVLFALVSGIKAILQGRGVAGFFLSASGADMAVGYGSSSSAL